MSMVLVYKLAHACLSIKRSCYYKPLGADIYFPIFSDVH